MKDNPSTARQGKNAAGDQGRGRSFQVDISGTHLPGEAGGLCDLIREKEPNPARNHGYPQGLMIHHIFFSILEIHVFPKRERR